MSALKPLTALAHEIVAEHLDSGDLAIDATVGNGHDTCFLAERVGPEGHVYGFDVQQQALDNARRQVEAAGVVNRVTLFPQGHEEMASQVPAAHRGKIVAVLFNLGYLPGSDKSTITRTATTVKAIEAAVELLASDGVISILAYRGHTGGKEEAAAVETLMGKLQERGFKLRCEESPGPVLYILLGNQGRFEQLG